MRSAARGTAALLAMALAGVAHADCISITGSVYSQNFNTLANTGLASALPPGWLIRETGSSANGQYAGGTGSSTTGDTYSFGSAGTAERALGGLRSNALAPSWGACFTNATDAPVGALDLAYTGEQWRFGVTGRTVPDRVDFQYSLDATSLGDGTWIDVDALDFATPALGGTAGLRDGNVDPNRAALAATLDGFSLAPGATIWIRWNDADISSSDDGLAIDDFSLAVHGDAGGPPALEVGDTSADEGDAGTTPLFFTFRLDKPAGAAGVVIGYTTQDGTATAGSDYAAASDTVTIPAGETAVTIAIDGNGDTAQEADETFTLAITSATGAGIADAQAIGTIRNDDFVVSAIHDIQGPGATSPLANQFVTTVGVVTGRKGNGFFLQASDAEADADPLTSEGVFVFTGSAPSAAAAVGNRVRVRGTVFEFVPPSAPGQLPLTEIGGSPSVTMLSGGHALPAPIALTAAMTDPAGGFGQLEPLEGMRVTGSLTTVSASDGFKTPYNATGGINGILQAVITGIARPFREPGISVLDAIPGGGTSPPIPRWDANPEIVTIDSDTLASGAGLIGANYQLDLPAGSVIEGLTGPLDYGFGRYTIHRDPMVPLNVTTTPRPRAARVPGGNEFTVAAYNMERFFDTVDDPAVDDDRANAAAYATRLQKASLGVRDYLHAPDVLAAIEIENLGVLQALAAKINADAVAAGQADPQYVAYLFEGHDIGGIDIGYLVKTAPVAGGKPRVEALSVAQPDTDPFFEPGRYLNDRPPLLLKAVVNYDDGRAFPITVVGVHQRSFNDTDVTGAAGDRARLKRLEQAKFLANLVQGIQTASPQTRVVVLGDFNAFAFNDGLGDIMGVTAGTPVAEEQTVTPGDAVDLVDPDLVNLGELAPASERYSYSYEGHAQTLDHVLVNEELIVTTRTSTIDHARINADFSDSNRSDATTPTRLADHDPVIAYFDPRPVADLAITATADAASVSVDGTLAFTATAHNNGPEAAESVGVGFALDAVLPTMAVAAPAGWSCDTAQVDAGRTSVACHATALAKDADAQFAITAATTPDTAHATVSLAAAVDALSLDPQPGNDQATASLEVAARVDLSLRIAGPAKKLHYASLAPFAIDLRNAGTYTAKQATMTLRGDAPAANVSVTAPAGWQCTVADTVANSFEAVCGATALLAIDVNQHFDVVVNVPARSDSTQFLTLTATAASASIETAPANNAATYQNRIVGVP
ncbi:Calx-beta domain-containing protein [Lysobacter solisilvae (ex Woo and Kim 2020)]|uniref:Nuclease n=1 Tax=Agrilutibacter terrestris TaxID=2865112 RepID=A0A7H0FZK9_9GAMM|nr:Calx-beta domain-containing protein [Lysobacter terrestris]QNP41475.1 nuclease [Lysobacter terrestris]